MTHKQGDGAGLEGSWHGVNLQQSYDSYFSHFPKKIRNLKNFQYLILSGFLEYV